ncbi:hypothetical protein ACJ2A9_18085 [Anaerobacillus sp. MEB173]|uniref:hypothetical protein n=1 Tax=Anaerobacillus sp. MEB173 TaxID=3383345 RepID=UPI003F904F26
MGKRPEHDEESIEKLLSNMPKIKDKRTKEELYTKIQARLQTGEPKKRSGKKWLMPSFATAAVVIIVSILVFPQLLAEDNMLEMSQESGDQVTSETENSIFEDEHAEIEEKADTNMMVTEESDPVEVREEGYLGALNQKPEGTDWVTISVPNDDAQFVVPLTILIPEDERSKLDHLQTLLNTMSYEKWGLDSPPLSEFTFQEADYHEDGKKVIIHAPSDNFTITSSTESLMFIQSVQETFAALGYKYVEFMTDGKPGMNLGPYGEREGFSLEENNKAYYLYTSETDHQLLIRGSTLESQLENTAEDQLTFQETIEQMKLGNNVIGYEASIPLELSITKIESENDLVKITFESGTSFENNDKTIAMIEAILFTAKEFGFTKVRFVGVEGIVGSYNLNTVIDVPEAVNLAGVQK